MSDDIRPMPELRRGEFLAPPEGPEHYAPPAAGAEWATASLVPGAVFAVMVPPCLVLIAVLGHNNPGNVAIVAGCFFVLLILLLSMAGLGFGVLGMNAAQRARRPIALGLVGVMLNALNLLMWAGTLLAWVANWL